MTSGIPPLAVPPAAAEPDTPKPKNAGEAAKQFEALMIAQMLRSTRESGGGGALDDPDDSTSSTMFDMANQQFAKLLADNGGFGLSRLIVKGLEPQGKSL
jgi:Rod binding domain-containing protein